MPTMHRRAAAIHDLATRAAADTGGVLSRARLADLGVDRADVARHVRERRWRLHGDRTVAVHTGDLGDLATRWRAIWEVGERIAILDGATALIHAGLQRFDDTDVQVSVPHTVSTTPVEGVIVHKVRRHLEAHVERDGIPRARPAAAALRAAYWARSDRQAALVLLMTIQQRLCTPGELMAAQEDVRGRTRRAFVKAVVLDAAGGAHSLGELDFARICRRHGLPEPTRQVVRRGPRGRVYLDVRWECGLVVEIDGAGHRWGLAVTDDNLRQNAVTLTGDTVLRVDVVGLRLAEAQFMAQVVAAHRRLSAA